MVNQVPVIGILMIVQGTLATLMGLMLAGVGAMIQFAPHPRPEEEKILAYMSIGYASVGVLVLISGVLTIFGGISALKFRSRTFVIVALFSNIVPALTCYCTPTAIGMIIYGLIVIFQSDVATAFEMVADGASPDDVKRHFDRLASRNRRDYDDDEEDDRDDDRRPTPRIDPPRNLDKPPEEGFKSDDRD